MRKVRIAAAASAGASPGRTTRVSVRQTSGAEGRRRLELRAVEARQRGAREEIEVDVHRIGVDEEDRPRPGQPPRRPGRPHQIPDQPGGHAALAIEIEKGDDADERRQRHRQGEELTQDPPPRELGAREEEAERHADRPGESDRRERDPQAAQERRSTRPAGSRTRRRVRSRRHRRPQRRRPRERTRRRW